MKSYWHIRFSGHPFTFVDHKSNGQVFSVTYEIWKAKRFDSPVEASQFMKEHDWKKVMKEGSRWVIVEEKQRERSNELGK